MAKAIVRGRIVKVHFITLELLVCKVHLLVVMGANKMAGNGVSSMVSDAWHLFLAEFEVEYLHLLLNPRSLEEKIVT